MKYSDSKLNKKTNKNTRLKALYNTYKDSITTLVIFALLLIIMALYLGMSHRWGAFIEEQKDISSIYVYNNKSLVPIETYTGYVIDRDKKEVTVIWDEKKGEIEIYGGIVIVVKGRNIETL